MASKKCPRGTIKRKAYTSKRGNKRVHVKANCIKAVSQSGSKRSVADRAYIKKRERIQKNMRTKYGSKRCPEGKIERAGHTRSAYSRRAYTRKDGTRVRAAKVGRGEAPPVCVKDTGARGKGQKLPLVLEKGVLKKYGYDDVKTMNANDRHEALTKAHRAIKPLSLYRKLVIVSTMNRRKDPKVAKIFKDDANWVKKNFGLTSAQTAGAKRGSKRSGSKKSGSKRTTRKSTGSKRSKSSRANSRSKTKRSSSKTKRTSSKTRRTGSKTKRGSKTTKRRTTTRSKSNKK